MNMKTLIQLEDLAKFILSYLASLYLGFAWWVFPAWLLVPDLSMLGYLANPRLGAWLYNFFHHQALGILVGIAGLYFSVSELQLAGIVLFGHSAMDRIMGYGLKYTDDFKHTHLGWIGKAEKKQVPQATS